MGHECVRPGWADQHGVGREHSAWSIGVLLGEGVAVPSAGILSDGPAEGTGASDCNGSMMESEVAYVGERGFS